MLCGALHTLVLTPQGQVYSWGCNDEKALGWSGSDEHSPNLVHLEIPVDMISVGDNHSVAANSILGVAYFWGAYRSEVRGRFYGPIEQPIKIEGGWGKRHIQKIISGENHVMILSEGRVYV